jgi:hypothetical protein
MGMKQGVAASYDRLAVVLASMLALSHADQWIASEPPTVS